MDRPAAIEDCDKHSSCTSAEKEAQIKELENFMKKVMSEKDVEIEHNRKELDELKLELENKVAEIREKDDIIRSLEDEEKSTAEESDAEDSDDEEEDQTKKSGRNEASGKVTSDTGSESEGEFDLFQLEVVSDEEV